MPASFLILGKRIDRNISVTSDPLIMYPTIGKSTKRL